MFKVGNKVELISEILEGKYKGIRGKIVELPEENPAGAYRFKPDTDYPDEPETWLIFGDEMKALED